MKNERFLISATIDFPDDCQYIPFNEEMLAQLMDGLQFIGARRVYWGYYQPGRWDAMFERSEAIRETFENLGKPITVASQLAKQRDLEFYAIIKPYETGGLAVSPTTSDRPGLPCIGGVRTELDPWVISHPELRVRARAADVHDDLERVPVERIQLRQQDMTPVRIKPENLEIWTSDDNCGYHKQDVTFAVNEDVAVCPRDVYDVLGHLVTRKGERVRVLNLTGLSLCEPFIAVTTNIDDETGSFRNTASEMIRAYGPGDQPLSIVVASHKTVSRRPRDLRSGDLVFDGGIGDVNICLDVSNVQAVCPHCRERGYSDCMQMPLFPEEPTCRDGVIAFARDRNEYLSCAVCEAYPEVQSYWLSWVGDCLKAGVDGIDWRISNHSCWTDTPELYGFNEPVLKEYGRRYDANPDVNSYDPELLGAVRGDFYDQFLRRVKHRLSAAGKNLQVHLEVESYRPNAPLARRRTRPGLITFNWQRWLRTGLADEATLMGVNWTPQQILADTVGQKMVAEARASGVPVYLRHHMFSCRDGNTHADRMEYAYRSDVLSGYNYYDAACLYDRFHLSPDGRLEFYPGMLEALKERAERLDLL